MTDAEKKKMKDMKDRKDILDFRHIQLESESIEKAMTICLFKDGHIEIYWNRKLI